MPSGKVSYTVLSEDGPIEPIESYLAICTAAGRAENTLKAYAHDLTLWWRFLATIEVDWAAAGLDELGRFLIWAQRSAPLPDGTVPLRGEPARSRSTVDRSLSSILSFYDFQQGSGAVLSEQLAKPQGQLNSKQRARVGALRRQRRPVRMSRPTRLPRTLDAASVQVLLNACSTRRDRLLLSLWWTSGLRVGQTLGLRHEDFQGRLRQVRIVRRANVNGAWAKNKQEATIPVLPEVVRLHREYMFEEYGDSPSDHVFVVLAGPTRGQAMTASAVDKMVGRLRQRTGIYFSPHMLRHSFSTDWLADGGRLEMLREMLTHASVDTTSQYIHLSPDHLRAELESRTPRL
jgi:site-specific recombinase XerD